MHGCPYGASALHAVSGQHLSLTKGLLASAGAPSRQHLAGGREAAGKALSPTPPCPRLSSGRDRVGAAGLEARDPPVSETLHRLEGHGGARLGSDRVVPAGEAGWGRVLKGQPQGAA